MKMNIQVKLILYEWFRMKTCFDTEAKGTSETADSFRISFALLH